MTTYQIISTGNMIIADQAFMDAIHPNDYTLIPVSGQLTQKNGTLITPRAFFNRLGRVNATWLYTQAQTNPVLEMFKDQVLAGPVDLAAAETVADLNYLTTVAGTPFTAAIVAAILSAPVQAGEVPG